MHRSGRSKCENVLLVWQMEGKEGIIYRDHQLDRRVGDLFRLFKGDVGWSELALDVEVELFE